jgi:hypothetical protein
MRYTPMRYTPVRFTPMRHTLEIGAREMHAREVHAHETLTNGGAVVDLSRSELQNTSLCASCGVVPIALRMASSVRPEVVTCLVAPSPHDVFDTTFCRRSLSLDGIHQIALAFCRFPISSRHPLVDSYPINPFPRWKVLVWQPA